MGGQQSVQDEKSTAQTQQIKSGKSSRNRCCNHGRKSPQRQLTEKRSAIESPLGLQERDTSSSTDNAKLKPPEQTQGKRMSNEEACRRLRSVLHTAHEICGDVAKAVLAEQTRELSVTESTAWKLYLAAGSAEGPFEVAMGNGINIVVKMTSTKWTKKDRCESETAAKLAEKSRKETAGENSTSGGKCDTSSATCSDESSASQCRPHTHIATTLRIHAKINKRAPEMRDRKTETPLKATDSSVDPQRFDVVANPVNEKNKSSASNLDQKQTRGLDTTRPDAEEKCPVQKSKLTNGSKADPRDTVGQHSTATPSKATFPVSAVDDNEHHSEDTPMAGNPGSSSDHITMKSPPCALLDTRYHPVVVPPTLPLASETKHSTAEEMQAVPVTQLRSREYASPSKAIDSRDGVGGKVSIPRPSSLLASGELSQIPQPCSDGKSTLAGSFSVHPEGGSHSRPSVLPPPPPLPPTNKTESCSVVEYIAARNHLRKTEKGHPAALSTIRPSDVNIEVPENSAGKCGEPVSGNQGSYTTDKPSDNNQQKPDLIPNEKSKEAVKNHQCEEPKSSVVSSRLTCVEVPNGTKCPADFKNPCGYKGGRVIGCRVTEVPIQTRKPGERTETPIQPNPDKTKSVADESRPVKKLDWEQRRHLQRLRHADKAFSKSKVKFLYWIVARCLTNEELHLKMLKTYKEEIFTGDWSTDLATTYDRMQNFESEFMTLALHRLPRVAASFLLSPVHRNLKSLELPFCFESFSSIMEFISDSDIYDTVRRQVKQVEERKNAKIKKLKQMKQSSRSVPSYIRLALPSGSEWRNSNDCRSWWKDTANHSILCGRITPLEDDSGFEFCPLYTTEEGPFIDLFIKRVRAPTEAVFTKLLAHGSKDEFVVDGNDVPGIALWMPSGPFLSEEQQEKGHFPLVMRLFGCPVTKSRLYYETCLPRVYRDKPFGCSLEHLTSYPWVSNCRHLLTKVRCFVRYDLTFKNPRPKMSRQSLSKKNKGKRGKRGRGKYKFGGFGKGGTQGANEHHLEADATLGSGDAVQKNDYCPFDSCREFREDLEMKDVSTRCQAITVLPLYERTTKRLIFYTAEDDAADGGVRKVSSVFPHALPQVFCDAGIDAPESEEGNCMTDDKAPVTLTSSSGNRHHHGNLVVDILMPKFWIMAGPVRLDNIIADVSLLLRAMVRYTRDVYAYLFAFQLTGWEVAHKQIQETQFLFEDVFSLLMFGSACGMAEMHLRGGYYVTSAHEHYRKARDCAIEAGILPVFYGFIREDISKFPRNSKISTEPEFYSILLAFLDTETDDTEKGASDSNPPAGPVEPVAVSLLECVTHKGFTKNMDDDIAFRALQHATGDTEHPSDSGLALLSPVAEPKFSPTAMLRERGFADLSLTQESFCRKVSGLDMSHIDGIVDEIVKEIHSSVDLDSLCGEDTKESDANDDSKTPEGTAGHVWGTMFNIFKDVQEKNPGFCDENLDAMRRDRKAQLISFTPTACYENDGRKTRRPPTPPQGGSHDAGPAEGSLKRNGSKSEDVPNNSPNTEPTEKLTNPTAIADSPPDAATTQNENEKEQNVQQAETVKVQLKAKKSTRGYMSTEKRQQRQVQRLKDKWEKRHRTEKSSKIAHHSV